MTEPTTAPADAAALAEAAAKKLQEEAAEAAAAAKRAHDAAIAALQPQHDAALTRIDALRAGLAASFEKAKADPDHLGYAGAFIRDVELKAAEILAWIQRHV